MDLTAGPQVMTVSFYGWDPNKQDQVNYLVVEVTGPEEGCTAVKKSGDASGGRMFDTLMSGKDWYSQIDIDDPASEGLFDPTKRKHWRTLRVIYRSIYDHVGVVEGTPA